MRSKKWIGWALAGLALFLFMFSCSPKQKFLSWRNVWDFRDPGPRAEESIAQFVSDIRPYQGNREAYYRLACYYQEQERYREALLAFRKAHILDPQDARALNGMGVSYDQLKEYPKAVEAYRKALQIDPNFKEALNNLGYSYLLQGKAAEAIPVLQKAVALDEREGRFHNNLGLAYALSGQLDLALEEFKRGGEESKAHYNVAKFYYEKGLYSVARFHYTAALSLDPSFLHARAALAAIDALMRIFQPGTQEPMAEEKTIEAASHRPLSPDEEPGMEQVEPAIAFLSSSPVAESSPERKISSARPGAEAKPSFSLNEVGIEVSNGNGVNRMARRVGRFLEERGLKVTRLTNADHFRHPQTRVFYREGYGEAARNLAGQLPVKERTEPRKNLDRSDVKVKVLIGQDIIPYQKMFPEG